jgi:tRNA(fMet)-specific endonuclease VapC
MTGFMLDTDISSYIIRRRPSALVEKFEKHSETLNVSVITAAELRFGAEKAARPKLTELVEAYLDRLADLIGRRCDGHVVLGRCRK